MHLLQNQSPMPSIVPTSTQLGASSDIATKLIESRSKLHEQLSDLKPTQNGSFRVFISKANYNGDPAQLQAKK